MLQVEVDPNSGFCAGVIRAINIAEENLRQGGRLYSLGDIVHNEAELERLGNLGLVPLDRDDLDEVVDARGEKLLIRAHGEPPSTYATARRKGFEIVDCTCSVVLRLQKKIREVWQNICESGDGGQIVIFGRVGHAEVLGLAGQIDGNAVVVENLQSLGESIRAGLIDLHKRIEVFSQTTKDPVEYKELCTWLKEVVMRANDLDEEELLKKALVNIHETICSQVATRHSKLVRFASTHSIIIFVSGRASSNGKVLCELCRSNNIRTYHIHSVQELKEDWFRPDDNVGVCGATSTPKWLLDKTAAHIEKFCLSTDF